MSKALLTLIHKGEDMSCSDNCNCNNEENVTISKAKYDRLLYDSEKLNHLEACGVDNWSGWDDAMEMLHGE